VAAIDSAGGRKGAFERVRSFLRAPALFGLLWVLGAWFGARLFFSARVSSAVRQGTSQAEIRADGIAGEISRSLHYFHGIPAVLSESGLVAQAIVGLDANPRDPRSRAAPLQAIDRFMFRAATSLGTDAIFLLDATGLCIASSNSEDPASFVGTDFADRDYFRAARAGRKGQQFAVGRRTGIPGFFFSAPVLAEGRFIGALVVKVNLSRLTFWIDQADAFIADPNGVVVMAKDARLVMRSLPDTKVERLSAKERGERYVRQDFRPLSMRPWGSKEFPSLLRMEGYADPVALISRRMPQEGTDVYVLARFPEIASFDSDSTWLFAILGLSGVAIIAAVSGRRASRSRESETQRALQESEERFRVAFKSSPDAIAINRVSDGLYLEVNEGFARMTGYEESEVVGRTSIELGIWVDPEDRRTLIEALAHSGATEVEARFRRKNGTVLIGAMSAKIISVDGVANLLSVTRDITDWRKAQEERARLEEQLRQAQKIESIGRLAGGVAHDFNNILTVILSCAEEARALIANGSPVQPELIDEISSSGQRAADLTRQLLAFARKQVIAPVPMDLNAVVRGSEKLLHRLLGEHIELVTGLQPGLWAVRSDPGQMEQVIVNLAINARDAMPSGGKLTIESANVEIGAELVTAHPFMHAGHHVRLTISDSGSGMAPEVKDHVFEPFFTTKPQGRGTGLGLATVYGIVKQSEGYVLVESELGRGTTFQIYLPRAAALVPRAKQRPPSEMHGSETIMVVEDDAEVREVTLRSLKAGGYRVIVATNGADALKAAAQEAGAIELLITDVVMPGLNGRQLADALRGQRPEMRVLFISGYADDILSQAGVLDSGVELLAKPFTPALLQEQVRKVIDAGRGEGI